MPAKSSSTKTKSSKSTSARSLKAPGSLLPLTKKLATAKQNKKQKVHKAKDIDLRDQLNEEDISLRRALEADNQPKGPIIERKEAPKELAQRGSELAEAMDELAMAFK
ncbi:uncharacterized protein JCM6883_004660 [Sporobolomyces salmoneus]|uniref:uncharacterized protein n=1 Tax=Sporobolomyces salmoneus TaxID=183962 RepID=UPI003176B357